VVEPLKLACGLVSEWKERSRREAPAAARYLDDPQRCERFADGRLSGQRERRRTNDGNHRRQTRFA
jgi:hypothetical protein